MFVISSSNPETLDGREVYTFDFSKPYGTKLQKVKSAKLGVNDMFKEAHLIVRCWVFVLNENTARII